MKTMPSEPDQPARKTPPFLRGLNPDGLAEVLGARLERPVVPGWQILEVAGEGGLGVVWRAVRESDGVVAAVKIARGEDQDTVERIEAEASALRALAHGNIVPLLDAGALEDGGLFLAMRFIPGPTLAQTIPPGGLPPERAYALFRGIAAAVAHAHGRGILHRDLKPANILLAPPSAEGGEPVPAESRTRTSSAEPVPMVADFGLARPVHERVEHLSLTQAGLIAGTVEYLPPEAYLRGYHPTAGGDVYALGVILYEMLAGTPPRGAWAPAAQLRRVDVRVDEVLRRAMHPEPARRWGSVSEMSAALEAIHKSPPRFAGSPLVTQTTQTADALWTVLGLALAFVTLCTLIRMDKAMIPVPIDLIGKHSVKTGGFQALFYLMQALVPLCVWQLARLWRFRRVPLREGLPSPFGLRLGGGKVAAVLVASGQTLCLLLPLYFLYDLYVQCGTVWVRTGDGPWAQGLCVTPRLGPNRADVPKEALSPWAKAKPGYTYYLKHVMGPPEQPSSFYYDRIGFIPFYIPAEMVAVASLAGLTLLATLAAGLHGWTMRRRWLRAAAMLTLAPLSALSFSNHWRYELAKAAEHRLAAQDTAWTRGFMPARSNAMIKSYWAEQPEGHTPIPAELVAHYAAEVDYRDAGKIARERIAELHLQDIARGKAERRTMWNPAVFPTMPGVVPGDPRRKLTVHLEYVRLTDPPPADPAKPEAGPFATAANCHLFQEGDFSLTPGLEPFRFHKEVLQEELIYSAASCPLHVGAAANWHRQFLAALATSHASSPAPYAEVPATEPLLGHFHTDLLVALDRKHGEGVHDDSMDRKRGSKNYLRFTIHDLRRRPGLQPAGSLDLRIEQLPGARGRIRFPMRERTTTGAITFVADLAHIDGAWRCVQLFYEPPNIP